MTWAFEYLTSRINQYPKVRDSGYFGGGGGVGGGGVGGGAGVVVQRAITVNLGLKYSYLGIRYV